jgi:hypothetical protein
LSPVALLYAATLTPAKIDLLTGWAPTQPWFPGGTALEQVGAYRFDDPGGEVGIETFLLRTDAGHLIQVPLTYRGAPLEGGEVALVTRMEHSVLGPRWVYDGCGDPVYVAALATAMTTGGTEAGLELHKADGERVTMRPTVNVRGSGTGAGAAVAPSPVVHTEDGPTAVMAVPGWTAVLVRVIDAPVDPTGADTLSGTWSGRDTPALLALVRQD